MYIPRRIFCRLCHVTEKKNVTINDQLINLISKEDIYKKNRIYEEKIFQCQAFLILR